MTPLVDILCELHEEGLGAFVRESPEGVACIFIDMNAWNRKIQREQKVKPRYQYPAIGAAACGGLREYRGKKSKDEEKNKCIGDNAKDTSARGVISK